MPGPLSATSSTASPPSAQAPHGQPPRRGASDQRLLGVDDEVHDHLVQLVGVAVHRRQAGRQVEHHVDVGAAQPVAGQLQRAHHHLAEHHRPAPRRPRPRHGEEGPHDAGAALGGGVDLLDPRRHRRVGRHLAQHRGIADDDRERVVELVRHAGEQRPERRQLLALVQRLARARHLRLGGAQRGQVDRARHDRRLALEQDRPRGQRRRHLGAVGAPQHQLEVGHLAPGGDLGVDPVALAGSG